MARESHIGQRRSSQAAGSPGHLVREQTSSTPPKHHGLEALDTSRVSVAQLSSKRSAWVSAGSSRHGRGTPSKYRPFEFLFTVVPRRPRGEPLLKVFKYAPGLFTLFVPESRSSPLCHHLWAMRQRHAPRPQGELFNQLQKPCNRIAARPGKPCVRQVTAAATSKRPAGGQC